MDRFKYFYNDECKYTDEAYLINGTNGDKLYKLKEKETSQWLEVPMNIVCELTTFVDKNNKALYENDIIGIHSDEGVATFILKHYDGIISIGDFKLYYCGLALMDFQFNPYLIGADIKNNNSLIEYIGNTIINNISEV